MQQRQRFHGKFCKECSSPLPKVILQHFFLEDQGSRSSLLKIKKKKKKKKKKKYPRKELKHKKALKEKYKEKDQIYFTMTHYPVYHGTSNENLRPAI